LNNLNDQSNAAERKRTVMDLLFLTLIWLLSVTIVNPIGDFPLNDDWSFGLAVQYFLQLGSFHPTGWTAMPLLTNVFWGSLFCLPEGFSFTALRVSTLTASWLGILGVYWLVRELGRSRFVALLAAFTVAYDPLYFEISNTFMTDVLCLTLMTFSAIFFLKNLKNDAVPALVAGTIFSVAAILSRQIGLAVPFAFTLVAIVTRGFKPSVLVRALAPSILGAFVLAGFQHWMAVSGRLPKAYTDEGGKLLTALLHPASTFPSLVHLSYVCLVSTGVLLSPLLFFAGPALGRATAKTWYGAGGIFVALAGLLAYYRHTGKLFMMPLATNNLSLWGLGPLTLHDAIYLPANPLPMLPHGFWVVVTVIGLVGATCLIYRTCSVGRYVFSELVFPLKWSHETQGGVFLLVVVAIYMGPIMLSPFFDRYLIPMIPFLAGFLAAFKSQEDGLPRVSRYALIVALLFGLAVFSVCGTRDYLAWTRARWQALDELMAKDQVKPESIDGGFEFNGYYLYSPVYRSVPGKSFWWVADDEYMVTFNPVPGYSIVRDYQYTHWMPPYTGEIYVLKRDSTGVTGQ
jgi:hypothetical protein